MEDMAIRIEQDLFYVESRDEHVMKIEMAT